MAGLDDRATERDRVSMSARMTRESPLRPGTSSGSSRRSRDRSPSLRCGWTTGTCASAAAKAAAIGLVTGEPPHWVDVAIPDGRRVAFPVVVMGAHRCGVRKDAGDDPDCTHGALVCADVTFASGRETIFVAGEGVGTVTKPGLGLPVGDPAINPVPRRMIRAAVGEVTDRPLRVEIFVPGGEEMATKTTNERLGIVGGISILGTTGIVRPFSTAAWRASVVKQIDVVAASGQDVVVLATGSRSDRAAQRLWPELPETCFVEVGDFTGVALRHAASKGIREVRWVGMVGKITKLAAGVTMTHFRRTRVDTGLLERVALECGCGSAVVESAGATETARHFFETCMAEGDTRPLRRLCEMACERLRDHVGGRVSVSVTMVDFEGAEVVASAGVG
ncbi:MAG: cobalt-precorrin-5B C(1)-methyltransferase [Acidimicrobiales bacterium]|nr:MAG: cobalt-precorrin-5B C(1)-methyltransferase [Acidimicrobiales bacterium]